MRNLKFERCLAIVLLVLVIAASLLCSCTKPEPTETPATTAPDTTTPATTTPTTTTPDTATPATTPAATPAATEANWWDKFGEPQYGGSMSVAVLMFPNNFDPYMTFMSHYRSYEGMFIPDLTVDRNEWSFKIQGIAPKYVGWLAESWEWEDPVTLVVKLRQGVKWHDCAPTYGREFTADDVVYHYDRSLGTGEFTEPNPFFMSGLAPVKSVIARDKYTVVVNFKKATPLANWWSITDEGGANMIESREFVESQDYSNWQNCAGTGPFMVTDFTAGSSITYSRNPDYYLNDERYPDNPIPYLDEVKMLCILDESTQIAGMRSGQVDMLINLPWQQTQSLQKTNPDIQFSEAANFAMTLDMRLDTAPFNDIRVRKALQLAIDIPTIAELHYGNPEATDPPPYLSPWHGDWAFLYEDWPEDLKQEYTYDPEQAKQLLSEAGYPDGFDTNAYVISFLDLDLVQLVKASFAEIGVNMEIKLMEQNEFEPFIIAGKHDQMFAHFAGASLIMPPTQALLVRTSTYPQNAIFAPAEDAAYYDDLYDQFISAADEAEAKELGYQMQEYIYRQHWGTLAPCQTGYDACLPRIKGWSGENLAQYAGPWFWARCWAVE